MDRACKNCQHWQRRVTRRNKIPMSFGWCKRAKEIDYYNDEKDIYKLYHKEFDLSSVLMGENLHTGENFSCCYFSRK